MLDARSLPQFGTSLEIGSVGSSNRSSGNHGRSLHAGIFAAPVSTRPSHAVSHVRTDGANGPRLAVGIRSLLYRFMSYRNGNSRLVSYAGRHNNGVNLQLVPAVSQFSFGASLASGRHGLRDLGHSGNMDGLSHPTFTLMPLSLLIKLIPVAGLAGGVFAFVEGGRALDILLSIAGSSAFIGLIGLIKYLVDRRDRLRSETLAIGRSDGQLNLEREKLVDAQTVALFKQLEEFYGFRDKEKHAVIELQKATLQQRDETIGQLQALITQQAATIQQLQNAGNK